MFRRQRETETCEVSGEEEGVLMVCGQPAVAPRLGEPLGAGVLHVLHDGEVYDIHTEAGCVTVTSVVINGVPIANDAEVWFERAGERSH